MDKFNDIRVRKRNLIRILEAAEELKYDRPFRSEGGVEVLVPGNIVRRIRKQLSNWFTPETHFVNRSLQKVISGCGQKDVKVNNLRQLEKRLRNRWTPIFVHLVDQGIQLPPVL